MASKNLADVISECIGPGHKWRCMVLNLIFWANAPLGWQEYGIIFIAKKVDYHCTEPGIEPCSKDCPQRVFNESAMKSTIITDFNLTCGKDWYSPLSQSILMTGILLGNILFGALSDKIGRKIPITISIILQTLFGCIVSFAPNIWFFFIFRFLYSLAAGGLFVVGFVITMEVVGAEQRSMFGILFQLTYYIGVCFIGVIGYLLPYWRYFQFAISAPFGIFLLYICYLPESPRWLLANGKKERAIAVLEKAAEYNGNKTDHIRNIVNALPDYEEAKKENFLDLFRSWKICFRTLCIWINWFVLGLTYFGVALQVEDVHGNLFVNTSVAGLIQIPGNLAVFFTLKKYGRKCTLIASYAICVVFMALMIIVPGHIEEMIFEQLGLIGISLAYTIMFIYTGELFPTIVRNTGLGSSSVCAKIGCIIAPFVNYLRFHTFTWLPAFIFGLLPTISIIVTLFLPETVNKEMPDTIEDAENFT